MSDYLRIQGSDSLLRDVNSMAVITGNTDDYENYKRKVNASLQMKAKLQEQEAEIKQLKSDITEIKEMLYQLLSAK